MRTYSRPQYDHENIAKLIYFPLPNLSDHDENIKKNKTKNKGILQFTALNGQITNVGTDKVRGLTDEIADTTVEVVHTASEAIKSSSKKIISSIGEWFSKK